MDLDDWCKLTTEQRNDRRLGWSQPSQEFYPDAHRLLDEAVSRFAAAFGDHPLIYHVTGWHWTGHKYLATPIRTYFEPTIAVLTALYAPQRIESIPDRFMTFAVVQDQMEDAKQYTIEAWRSVATNVFDWPVERVNQLAEKYADGLCGRDAWFYHETAMSHFLPNAIPQDLHPAAGLRFRDLIGKLEAAIELNESYRDPDRPTNWAMIRADVESILKTVVPRKMY
jgi:hypothetical protein